MRRVMRIVSVLFLLLIHFRQYHSECVMTECDGTEDKNHPPCKTNISSIAPITVIRSKNPDYFNRIEKFCSHLILEDHRSNVCCTENQIQGMTDRLSNAVAILGSCPSCFDNFAKLWCQFTCSPDQSDFMTVVETSGPLKIVERIEFEVSRDFTEGLYDSCKSVWFGNDLSLHMLTTDGKVSYNNFFGFMGKKNPTQNIPVNTDFVHSANEVIKTNKRKFLSNWYIQKIMNLPITPCHKSAGPNLPACGVIDCPSNSYQLLDLSGAERLGKKVFTTAFLKPEWALQICGCIALTVGLVFVLKYSCHRHPTVDGCYMDIGKGSLEIQFEHLCEQYATKVIAHPWKFVLLGLLIAAFCCSGNSKFHSLTNSIDQASSAKGETRQDRKIFFDTFGPTHRIEQVFLTLPPSTGTMFNMPLFEEMFTLVNNIKNLSVVYGTSTIKLDDICYKPLGEKRGCAIMSPTNYFQNNWETFQNAGPANEGDEELDDLHWEHLKYCIKNPLTVSTYSEMSCFGEFGGPIEPSLVFGGGLCFQYYGARTFMITILLNGDEGKCIEWEAEFMKMMSKYKMKNANFTFMTESSIANELQVAVETDKIVSVAACAAVLLWVFTMLGTYHWPEPSLLSALVHHKLLISVSAVMINVISVWCSIGVFSLFDVHATDNAIVVLFFVITCIGINRIFVTIRTFQSNGHCYGLPNISDREINHRITDTMRRSIPIVLTNSLICSTCFFLAGGVPPYVSVSMPAVEVFARHAGLAILFDTAFYLLVILPLFQYDARREMLGKCEIWPWYEISDNTKTDICMQVSEGTLRSPVDWFKIAIAPLLLYRVCRVCTIIVFSFTLACSLFWTLKLEYGFDQTMAFSKESYLTNHFKNMNKVLNTGPQVFFIVQGNIQWHEPKIQNKFCTLAGCDENSMGNKIRSLAYAENYEGNYLHGDVNIWLDSYLQFMHPRGSCCKTDGKHFCEYYRTV
uniref:SSD domain-containing protein n=2 Tax=Caenorhabditis tropicalis TaxID=1561998 RepID=A0A1I7V4V3_9PELO